MAFWTYVGNRTPYDMTGSIIVTASGQKVSLRLGDAADFTPAEIDSVDDRFVFVLGGVFTPKIVTDEVVESSVNPVDGDMLFRDGDHFINLPPGASGQLLQTSPSGDPQWTTVSGSGGTVPDSSISTKGIARLATAPTVPSDPIVVGTNDVRLTNERPSLPHTHPQIEVTNLVTDLADRQLIDGKGVANGYAGLDATGKVPATQLPAGGGGGGDVTAHSIDTTDIHGIANTSLLELVTRKGIVNGYPALDATGRIPSTQKTLNSIRTVSSSSSLLATDNVITADSTTSVISLTLPSAVVSTELIVKRQGANLVNVLPVTGDNIDNDIQGVALSIDYAAVHLIAMDSTRWHILTAYPMVNGTSSDTSRLVIASTSVIASTVVDAEGPL